MNFFFPSANLLTPFRSWFVARPQVEEPIRAELFSVERLEQYAESLAAAQPITSTNRHQRPLLAQVQKNGRILLASYRSIAQAIREEHASTPAAEWLVDNFHIVEEQVREIRDDLPPGYYRQLPKLAAGPLEGYPRVFGLVWAFVAHTDSRFDPEALRRFVRAYQRIQPLMIGELWAIAITLRVVLVDNLRRLTEQMVRGRAARQAADALADNLLGLESQSTVPRMTTLRRLEGAPLVTAFAVQLALRLRDQDPAVVPALRWLDERLAAQGTTADAVVRVEHQRQEAMNVTVRNVITSMRLISTFDWAEFFESVSLVDEVLRTDSDFAALDFATRDRYRHAIAELARGSQHPELEIARRVIAQTKRAAPPCQGTTALSAERQADPSYYLISKGRIDFERELGFRVYPGRWLRRAYATEATPGYLGTISVIGGIILALLLLTASHSGVSVVGLWVLGLFAAVPALDLAVALVNRIAVALLEPRALPKLELRDGIPARLRTMIVVPTLLTNPADIEEQIKRLEVHYLGNLDGELRFALLSDWTDATEETTPADDALLAVAVDGIARLWTAIPSLADVPEYCEVAIQDLTTLRTQLAATGIMQSEGATRIDGLIESLTRSAAASRTLIRRLTTLAQRTRTMFDAMEFGFLFDPPRKLLAIGYRVADSSLDANCYDLLASEARLASFIAIAKGDVPSTHWFYLGRPLTPVGRGAALISWSGSMFEYLMPLLVMYAPPESLLDQTYHCIVGRQRKYGAERGVPWGISESAFNARDVELTYQYANFGVPGLGLERGLSADIVVAPYATALAAMIDPQAAAQNFARLAKAGGNGRYGFYEALDYTPSRLPEEAEVAVVRAYMAHHQGMSLLAIANVLHDGVMRTRFHADPLVQATELLLQERTPRNVAVARPRTDEVQVAAQVRDFIPPVVRRFTTPPHIMRFRTRTYFPTGATG